MKRFRFRLQRILDIREQIRDELRQELARRNNELANRENVLRGLRGELSRLSPEADGTVTARELLLTSAYAARLDKLIQQQVLKVEEARIAVEEARRRYIEANKDAKALELLKDKKREEYTLEALKEEMNQLDETATQRARMRK